ncbi:MAG: hypothetical protein CL926_10670 [Deltaproteobacteria bacterium]|jgi:hypothetical protein|nr:hypothetical protein [Deltaproteobacteria bacterium]
MSKWHQFSRKRSTIAPLVVILWLLAGSSGAQSTNFLRATYPELATLFNAFDLTHAQAFEEIMTINENQYAQSARDQLEEHLSMMANMTMQDMMSSGMNHGGGMHMGMNMSGPYGDLEIEARIGLRKTMQGQHTEEAASRAFSGSSILDSRTAQVLSRGRDFENTVLAIYLDESINDKLDALDTAIDNYLSDDAHSVASSPKDSGFILTHPQAAAFKTAFPRLSAFQWTQQWLQLASIEAIIREHVDSQFDNGIPIALERFWNKIGSAGGMTMFPAPTELPMTPAIAPDLYSQSPRAAIIIDNLNVLETMIADILSYPNLENRSDRISDVVNNFTDKGAVEIAPEEYLLFALRGGIYNQGGPAVGELMQSERNRSREMMDMKHAMIMSTAQ